MMGNQASTNTFVQQSLVTSHALNKRKAFVKILHVNCVGNDFKHAVCPCYEANMAVKLHTCSTLYYVDYLCCQSLFMPLPMPCLSTTHIPQGQVRQYTYGLYGLLYCFITEVHSLHFVFETSGYAFSLLPESYLRPQLLYQIGQSTLL